MHRRFLGLLAVVLFPAAVWAGDGDGKRWIVVMPGEFKEAMEPLVKRRAGEGFDVERVASWEGGKAISAEKIREKVAGLCREFKGTSFVLLVGAAEAGKGEDAEKMVVPALVGTVGRMKGQVSDNGYGCIGAGDEVLPSVAVGRLPVHTAGEAAAVVKRMVAYEEGTTALERRGEMTLLIGDPGGSSESERKMAAGVVMKQFQSMMKRVDPMWEAAALVDVEGSQWTVPAEKLHETTRKMVGMGRGFVVYAGHSSTERMGWDADMMTRKDWMEVKMPASVFVTCGCFACQYAGPEGHGISAMRNAEGPVAVIGATGESYAMAGQLAFDGMLGDFARPELPGRLGEMYLHIKESLAKGRMSPLTFAIYDRIDGSNGKIPLEVQRKEHVEMWTLLGDPAMKLAGVREEIVLDDLKLEAGKKVTVKGMLPERAAGWPVAVTVERMLSDVPRKGEGDAMVRWELANRTVEALGDGAAEGRRFAVEVMLPAELPWEKMVVRVRAAKEGKRGEGEAVGAAVVEVEKK